MISSAVRVALQLPSGERLSTTVSAWASLWQLLWQLQEESGRPLCDQFSPHYLRPVLLLPPSSFATLQLLRDTTLARLNLRGSAFFRLSFVEDSSFPTPESLRLAFPPSFPPAIPPSSSPTSNSPSQPTSFSTSFSASQLDSPVDASPSYSHDDRLFSITSPYTVQPQSESQPQQNEEEEEEDQQEKETPLTDDDFELTPAELRVLRASLLEQTKAPKRLETKRLRDAGHKAAVLRDHPLFQLKIRFPDGLALLGSFRPTETSQCAYRFVRSHLRDPSLPFELSLSHPKRALVLDHDDERNTLWRQGIYVDTLLTFSSHRRDTPHPFLDTQLPAAVAPTSPSSSPSSAPTTAVVPSPVPAAATAETAAPTTTPGQRAPLTAAEQEERLRKLFRLPAPRKS
ncbi:MAG: hypothetical protein Q8P67_08155 [archaeon]|nr:hypothetical protein [archaeon]